MEAVKTVVVADDTAFVRDRFRAALAQAGHETLTVRTGAELLGLMRRTGERGGGRCWNRRPVAGGFSTA